MKRKSCAGIVLFTLLLFWAHRSVPFMMDDEWYATNLATGAQLQSLADILEGQIWHYLNWGGRSITHGILQLTLMSGELCADILNVVMTLLLAYMICVVSEQKEDRYFLLSLSLLICFNANVKMSMFWQSGLVNYIYSSVWILLFLWPYLRAADRAQDMPDAADKPAGKDLPGIVFWIIPLGIITGWSNENMGPSCCVMAVLVILYRRICRKQKSPLWMYLGAITSFIGSVMVIVAPGNFVRSNAIEKKGLFDTILERVFSMFQAGAGFLFPVCIMIGVLLILYIKHFQEKLRPGQILLLIGMVLSYGAMVLSPHYPDRATFGTMVLGIVLINTLLAGILKNCPAITKYMNKLQLCVWGYSMLALLDIVLNTGALV